MSTRHTISLNETLKAYFQRRPGQWIDGRDLARIAGSYGWRTRVSNVRKGYGMQIDNRMCRVKRADGGTYVRSEYRYTPAAEQTAQALPLGLSANG